MLALRNLVRLFQNLHDLFDSQNRVHAIAARREFRRAATERSRSGAAVNQDDDIAHDQSRRDERLDRLDLARACRDHVVNHNRSFARVKFPLDDAARAVFLFLAARINQWAIHLQCDRCANRQRGVRDRGDAVERQWREDLCQRARGVAQDARVRDQNPQIKIDRRDDARFQFELAKFDCADGVQREDELCLVFHNPPCLISSRIFSAAARAASA